jgi:hypothetical protein
MSDVVLSEMTRQGKLGCPSSGGAPYLKYNINKIALQVGTTNVQIGNNVNGFTVKNAGNTIVVFNQEQLQPGESFTVGGNIGEIYSGRVDIYFRLPVPPPGTPVNMCWITVKFYPQ